MKSLLAISPRSLDDQELNFSFRIGTNCEQKLIKVNQIKILEIQENQKIQHMKNLPYELCQLPF